MKDQYREIGQHKNFQALTHAPVQLLVSCSCCCSEVMCCPYLPAGGLWGILHREVPEPLVIVCLWAGPRLSGCGRRINRPSACHSLVLCQMRPYNAHKQTSVTVLARLPERRDKSIRRSQVIRELTKRVESVTRITQFRRTRAGFHDPTGVA